VIVNEFETLEENYYYHDTKRIRWQGGWLSIRSMDVPGSAQSEQRQFKRKVLSLDVPGIGRVGGLFCHVQ